MESKIPSISGLATTSELTAVENKTPAQSKKKKKKKKKKKIIKKKILKLKKKKKKKKKKTDYNTKISDIEKKLTDHNQSSTS